VAWLLLTLVASLLAPAQHIRAAASVSEPSAKPGATLSLHVDVVPNPGIHVYAPGAAGYQPIALTLQAVDGVTPGKLAYPKAEALSIPETGEKVPVYNKPFRLAQPITIAKTVKAGSKLTVTGTVRYQACDDQVCFIPAELPVSWTIDVK
jgi:DsbC/DsbD-like thiol-disulfide interchange protein